jgi:serine/threonine-protein kinase HipA
MMLAGKCGINIPDMFVQSIGSKDFLLLRRFDRKKHGDGWDRIGFLSSLSLMEWDEADRMSWDYGAIADIMRRYTSVNDIREFFHRMIFNILVRNTDDHPRNHGFLFGDFGVRLSPAYDIVPSLTQPGVGTTFFLAMTVGNHGREATFENALSRAARFGLSGKEAAKIVEKLVETVRGWRDHFSLMGCTEMEIQALAPSFSRCEEF